MCWTSQGSHSWLGRHGTLSSMSRRPPAADRHLHAALELLVQASQRGEQSKHAKKNLAQSLTCVIKLSCLTGILFVGLGLLPDIAWCCAMQGTAGCRPPRAPLLAAFQKAALLRTKSKALGCNVGQAYRQQKERPIRPFYWPRCSPWHGLRPRTTPS
jgi:hypothetical protein